MCMYLYVCVRVCVDQVWDYSIVNTRIQRDFNGNQADFTAYLLDKIKGEWKAEAAGW